MYNHTWCPLQCKRPINLSDEKFSYVSTDTVFQTGPCGICSSLAVFDLCTPGVGLKTRSISMPVCLFKEFMHCLFAALCQGSPQP